VCRNSIDPLDWPEPEKPTDGVFRVGYAASASHLYDAADIDRAQLAAGGAHALHHGHRYTTRRQQHGRRQACSA
jgi:hypothetical protein